MIFLMPCAIFIGIIYRRLTKDQDNFGLKNKKNIIYDECVFRFIDNIEIIIKDNGELFKPNINNENYILKTY